MELNNIIFEHDSNVGIITINRPKALNALNKELLEELSWVVNQVKQNDEIRALIITGTGEKAFVAGADIGYMENLSSLEGKKFSLLGQQIFSEIELLNKPVIAAINGFALGGGCELALACDVRFASSQAKFGQPEINLGIIPGFGGSQRLPRLIGKGLAAELLYTGDIIDANEAYRIGLVNKVVEPEKLMDTAKELAGKFVNKSPVILQLLKEAVNEGMEMELSQALAHEADIFGLCFSTEDQKEGMNAFLNKRRAQFKGQ
ncbi:MAG: short-chain-enoyl-CoA hydratase [Clostridia bacterium]|jgi:enoyl-CoA hydratase|nr:short-chain-enoyl-CoA hydratase [Clostridia bacterium]